MNTVIRVENLSKRYRLGLKETQAETLMGQIGNALKTPWENFKRLRALNRFGEEDDSVFWALKEISFEVKEGEVLGIIGKNGAGKSTLLKILSQITEPTSGKIEIYGRVASLLEVGTGFHPELSGRENIYMNGTILGMTKREINSKLDEIIDFSGVEKFIDTSVKFYSSGMKVRLGFSVAAHLDPEILIVDEVLSVGDFEFQKKCLGKMEDVSKNQGRTVIFVSHDLGAVSSLCPNGIVLMDGSVFKKDTMQKCIESYLNLVSKKMENGFNVIEDEFLKWIRIDILQNNVGVSSFYDNSDILIIIKFQIKSKVIGFRIYIDIYNSKGLLLSKNFFDEVNNKGSLMESGIYNTTCLINKGLFIEGKYVFVVRAGLHNFKELNPVDGYRFEIEINESGIFERRRFFNERGEIIIPMKWETIKE